MKFEDYRIADEIKLNLTEAGFKKPTDIQYKAIPAILKGEDVLAIAQTGTGKTAAFAIPVIDLILKKKSSSRSEGIKCLVMVPTRELATQITKVFQQLSKHTKVHAYGIVGGVEQDPQIAKLEKGIDILIATPGRLFDLVNQGHIRLTDVQTLILDEADHMLKLGFLKDIQDVIKYLPKKRQTLFFSATIDEQIKKIAYSLVTRAIRIQISPNDRVAKNISHSVTYIQMDDKRFFLERMIRQNEESKILVFVRTKVRAERVFAALERMGIKSVTLHGDKDQENRFIALEQFRSGDIHVMIATDVSARGIDIEAVDFVVNYDLPEQVENYVHRVGRTGRGVNKGQAVSFCSPEEKPLLHEIQHYLGNPINVLDMSKSEYEETINFTEDTNLDLSSLMKEVEEFQSKKKKPKKK
ncbi:ATP-dependent RNA helicase RhlE [Dyadobacter jejuensis]|uniref:ATP-dependent RNA helicase RhlE n=1 Tax=Dyadobacter jejuensis TaxID=1082580 RepID=A0A316AMF7_9BACT|nr:DEAD/DEAH box helicase [Dyadobacter jejuensis]PWJ58923.1 ATP-dependent RNA helicase RhlE [Dyadobacter jejuensis]